MANVVQQPSKNPTNKLSAAVIGAAVVEVARTAANHYAPEWSDPALWTALTPVIIFACGWLTPDAPNIVVITQDADQ